MSIYNPEREDFSNYNQNQFNNQYNFAPPSNPHFVGEEYSNSDYMSNFENQYSNADKALSIRLFIGGVPPYMTNTILTELFIRAKKESTFPECSILETSCHQGFGFITI